MLPFEEAQRIVLESIEVLGLEKIPLLSALDRVLGEEVVSGLDIPPWDNSAVDGYAVQAADVAGASPDQPVLLRVIEDLPAGRVSGKRLQAKEAIRIMTGAPMPAGADAVVMVEETKAEGGSVRIFRAVKSGANVRRRGEDLKSGSRVFSRGAALGAAEIGVLASLNKGSVFVHKRPQVAVLATGDELVEVGEPLRTGQIISSNTYTLTSQIRQSGGIPIDLGIARDDLPSLRGRLEEGAQADLLITSGGVSMGEYDLVKKALEEMAGEVKFWRVAIRPGMPTAFGILKGKPFFGLPGNPVSSMVCFELFARPALRKMGGHAHLFRPSIEATVKGEIRTKAGRRHFLRVRLERRNGRVYADLTGDQGSGILTSVAHAHGLAVISEDTPLTKAGEKVKVLLLDKGWEALAEGNL
ncbi:MAG: molybdopterin molybdotransferase MoeA [candidate division NC10 bacterium]|nr:molybdopterin molybdotransferase MoeA [candidate division NC10 bacterium]